jgi:FixJ family two-component response regulator
MGFPVRTFDRPSALLENRLQSDSACIVVDIYMPEMTGIELCHRLAQSGRELPAILITGRNDVATQRLAGSIRSVAVLYKPIDERPLLDAITRALALSRPQRP